MGATTAHHPAGAIRPSAAHRRHDPHPTPITVYALPGPIHLLSVTEYCEVADFDFNVFILWSLIFKFSNQTDSIFLVNILIKTQVG